jgi:hypothetical protein
MRHYFVLILSIALSLSACTSFGPSATSIFTPMPSTSTNTPSDTLVARPSSSPTLIPSITLTQAPILAGLTPIADAFTSQPQTEADTLTIQVLRKSLEYYPGFALYLDTGNMFGIKIVQDTLNPTWLKSKGATNEDKTLTLFVSYAPEPTPNPVATMTVNEYIDLLNARKLVIENLAADEIYRIKWEDYLPDRPIEPIGWIDNNIAVFGQCGNPSLCFVTAVNAKESRFLLTLELHDYP